MDRNFAITPKGLRLLIAGLVVMIAGYILMAGILIRGTYLIIDALHDRLRDYVGSKTADYTKDRSEC